MADKNDGGDKTEKPTAKRLADARKKGDVPKSKDVTATATLFVWMIVLMFGAGFAGSRLIALFDQGFGMVSSHQSFSAQAAAMGWSAVWALMAISALALLPAAITGLLTEFLQSGGLFTAEKLKPSFEKMNPVEGIKRMFSMDNLIELLKTIAKAALIVLIIWVVVRAELPDILNGTGLLLSQSAEDHGRSAAAAVLQSSGALVRTVLLWTLAVFLMVAVLDMAWQKRSFLKKMQMSLRDIKQEYKENEGDPLIKSNRRQMHEEWANQNAVGAARGANVLVVNPTHIAIALEYDAETSPVPVMTAKGEGPLAQAMREAAEEAGVPIVRHVPVARKLYEDGAVDEVIPRDMFEAIAQVILWAQKVRDGKVPADQAMDLGEAMASQERR